MQVVIDISEDDYSRIKDMPDIFESLMSRVLRSIRNSTVLPEDHGELVDRDAINARYDYIYTKLNSVSNKPSYKELLDRLSMCLDSAPVMVKVHE